MIKITNNNLVERWDALTRIGTANVGKPKFKWNIAKNKSLLKGDRDALNEGLKQDPKLTEYTNGRIQIYDKWAVKAVVGTKNQDGSDGSSTQYRVPPENLEAFEVDIAKLGETYKDILDAEKVRVAGIQELLNSIVEIEVHKIKMSLVPDSVNANDLATLWELWEDDLEDGDESESKEATPEPLVKEPEKN